MTTSAPLPPAWTDAIALWAAWLRAGGKRPATVRLRTDQLSSIVRRSKTRHPRQLSLNDLVVLCSERNWSNEYRKSVRSTLVGFYDWAARSGIVDANPAALLPKVRADAPRPRPAPDQVWADLLACAAPRERLMALLAGEAGLRRAEVAAVHCDDVHRGPEGYSLLVHGKGGRQRVVPLTDALGAQVGAYCRGGGYLFPGHAGGHISPAWAGTVISKLMPPGWTMHKLRHRYATRGYNGTGNLRAVQEALGHASVATTQRYTAVTSHDVRAVSEAAAASLSQP